ncbi:MAG: YHS domain-containing protein [Nitrospira sp.]|nr:YHS domain-containing protein [Nitrospira sp.]MDR4471046.1 YHS domain-containing protein [Nitrospira sp.]
MAQDPVRHMDVDERSAAAHCTYQGNTYDLCALSCREEFEKDPGRYLSKQTDRLGRKMPSDG